MSTSTVVYSTATGQAPTGSFLDTTDFDPTGALSAAFDLMDPVDDPHCFVCRRHTDHFAEHDALVAAGLATYGTDGSVYRTDAWDDEQAAAIARAEYRAYCDSLNLEYLDENEEGVL